MYCGQTEQDLYEAIIIIKKEKRRFEKQEQIK
jgi:hypothetical protein